jgi:hypothetical protein
MTRASCDGPSAADLAGCPPGEYPAYGTTVRVLPTGKIVNEGAGTLAGSTAKKCLLLLVPCKVDTGSPRLWTHRFRVRWVGQLCRVTLGWPSEAATRPLYTRFFCNGGEHLVLGRAACSRVAVTPDFTGQDTGRKPRGAKRQWNYLHHQHPHLSVHMLM